MASGKAEGTDSIVSILELVQKLEALGSSDTETKGLLDGMKARVKAKLSQALTTPNWSAGQAFSILSEAKEEDARKRQLLLDYYTEADSFLTSLNEMDKQILTLLQGPFGNVEENIANHKVQLEQKEYFLLVAGETCSGKSSLVNLILGEEILPYSILSTTSTICELKFGEERRIVAHFKDKDPETGQPTKTILLEEPTGSSEQSYLKQISPYVHLKTDREKGSPFKKIELFWPHSLLQKGIVIIDSPGVGESDEMDEMVIEYLPEAFAFLYVIDCTHAGGVQKDRLEKLLQEVRKVSQGVRECKFQEHLLSKCALFVCNKWDQVPVDEIEAVKSHVTKKLKGLSSGLDPESQIIYMSTKNATIGQKYGIVTKDFSLLMDGMRTVVLKSIEARLEIHWRWLDFLLSRIVFQAKVFVMNASRDRKKVNQRITRIVLRLDAIEKQQGKVMADLHKYLEERFDAAVQQLSEYLSSEEVKARFTSWTINEVPKAGGSWDETECHIAKVLSSRLREIIEEWEEDKKVFANARECLLQHFQQRYNFVEGQLQNLRQAAVTADSIEFVDKDPTKWLTTKGMFISYSVIVFGTSFVGRNFLGLSYPLLIALMGIPTVAGAYALLDDLARNKTYEGDKCAEMANQSAEYLAAATHRDKLKVLLKDQFKEAELCLKQIESRIPELIQADKMLYEQLIDESRTQKDKQDLYHPIMDEGSRLRGQLLLFGIKEVCADEISSEDLQWKEDVPSRLGRGTFAAVYQGTMRRNGDVKTVALKVFNDVIDAHHACGLMEEVENLRRLDHPNIVSFYGTSLIREEDTVRMVLVMEKCKGNLRRHMSKHPESVPGQSDDPDVVEEAYRWVTEITDALAYIHGLGVVHRDLKLENILVSEGNSVRIADVGLSKPAVDITGTFAGTPSYMAPEVFHSQEYDSKADIYSLGIVMWEMWYGQRAFAIVQAETLADLFSLVDDGYRPEHVRGCKKPLIRWKQLMEKCWKRNPDERPKAETCKNEAKMIVFYERNETQSVGF